jgi:flagellar biosynthesis chaperone FliJ
MARFTWRLQKVLDVKDKIEQVRRAELLRIAEQIAEARAALLNQQRILKEVLDQVAQASPSDRPAQQEFVLRHVSVNDEKIGQFKARIVELEAAHRQKAAELMEVRRSKEALARLKDKARLRFIQEQERLEQKESDDRAGVSFVRRQGTDAHPVLAGPQR